MSIAEFSPVESNEMLRDSQEALQDVRRALIELYAVAGADPKNPQEVARQFGMNRNLTWKLSRVINAPDPFASLNHLPGQQGIDLALSAFEKSGVPGESITHVKTALARLEKVVDVHAGDRDHFELTLESIGIFEREHRLDSGRELAYRGNSMIWGIQARTRFCAAFFAPNPQQPDTVDIAQVVGLIGFRRLRPSARWRLFRLQMHDDIGGAIPKAKIPEEIQPSESGQAPLILPEFCSPNMPPVESVMTPDGQEFVLPGGPIGNQAAFDCFFGYVARGLPAYRAPMNEFASIGAPITLPVEVLVFDLILHRDLPMASAPVVEVYGFPHGGVESPAAQTIHNLLPINQEPVGLPGNPPALATPLVPRYSQIAARVYERMGWNPGDFRGLRVEMPYAPMSSRVVLKWNLPEKV